MVGEETAAAGVVVKVDGKLRVGAAGVGADETVVGGEGGGRRRSRGLRRRRWREGGVLAEAVEGGKRTAAA